MNECNTPKQTPYFSLLLSTVSDIRDRLKKISGSHEEIFGRFNGTSHNHPTCAEKAELRDTTECNISVIIGDINEQCKLLEDQVVEYQKIF